MGVFQGVRAAFAHGGIKTALNPVKSSGLRLLVRIGLWAMVIYKHDIKKF